MHNTMIGSTGIDQDNHMAHDNSYSNEQWVDMSAYTHMAMTTYPGDYYIPPATHGLPSESIGMAPPPIPHPMHNQPHSNNNSNNFASHLPHPLIIPTQQPSQVPWPSLRTNPSQSYSAPPVPIPPASAPVRQLALTICYTYTRRHFAGFTNQPNGFTANIVDEREIRSEGIHLKWLHGLRDQRIQTPTFPKLDIALQCRHRPPELNLLSGCFQPIITVQLFPRPEHGHVQRPEPNAARGFWFPASPKSDRSRPWTSRVHQPIATFGASDT
ncbi:hypothetical protein F4814DRAFT_305353 [Daldinia grandis]|nr:hypothetical protein F4814DRAFT_305353 [Daldinia grandis]